MTPNQIPSHPLTRPPDTYVPQWLVDDYLASYLRWREECVCVRRAYAHWLDAARADRSLAFAAYRAALDREENAAEDLGGHTTHIRRLM